MGSVYCIKKTSCQMNRIHRGILRGRIGGNSPPNLKIAKFGGGAFPPKMGHDSLEHL